MNATALGRALRELARAQRAIAEALDAVADDVDESLQCPSTEQSAVAGPQLLTVREVAARLGVSPSYVYRELEAQRLPKVCMGSAVRVAVRDLEVYVEQHREGASIAGLAVALRARTRGSGDAGSGCG